MHGSMVNINKSYCICTWFGEQGAKMENWRIDIIRLHVPFPHNNNRSNTHGPGRISI